MGHTQTVDIGKQITTSLNKRKPLENNVSKYIDVKINAIKCFKSQFYDPKSKENDSFISTKEFMDFIKSRSIEMGHSIGVKHGEGFTSENKLKLTSLDSLF